MTGSRVDWKRLRVARLGMPDAMTIVLILVLLLVLVATFLGSGSDHPH